MSAGDEEREETLVTVCVTQALPQRAASAQEQNRVQRVSCAASEAVGAGRIRVSRGFVQPGAEILVPGLKPSRSPAPTPGGDPGVPPPAGTEDSHLGASL